MPSKDQIRYAQAQFRAHHSHRLTDAKERLPLTARHVLTALPTLLHVNQASLPGYCGQQIPAGIHGYQVDQSSLRAVRQFASGYTAQLTTKDAAQINAVYFMGSAGSVAQTRDSDLDVWVCLPKSLHNLMDKKLAALTQWADGLGVELQCFAVDPAQFTGGVELAFSPLLLDEFYRSACLIAGQFPLWWIIPEIAPASRSQLIERVLNSGFLRPNSTIDFGAITQFSALELFAAGVRELERSLVTPYKSLLKLALLESYHAGLPALSHRYRARILDGTPVAHIDSYIMLADHLATYFDQHPEFAQRQQFLQRAWLTKTSRGNTRLWKNPAWWERAHQWGYDPLQIDELRWPNKWRLIDIIAEHHRTIAEFAHALSFLSELERHCAPTDDAQIRAWQDLRERLVSVRTQILEYTQYNDKLFHAIVPKDHIGTALIEQDDTQYWCLVEQNQTLIRRSRLVEIVLWLKRQNLSLHSIQTTAQTNADSTLAYQQIYAALSQASYVAIVNAEIIAPTSPDERGDILINDAKPSLSGVPLSYDPLSYGATGICLVKHIDLVCTQSNHKSYAAHWQHFSHALEKMLVHINAGAEVAIAVIGDVRRNRIQQHLSQVLDQARDCLGSNNSTFLFQQGQGIGAVSRTSDGSYRANHYSNGLACYRQLTPNANTSFCRISHWTPTNGWLIRHKIFNQPSMLVSKLAHQLQIEFRDHHQYQVLKAPLRRVEDFLQSLNLYTALLNRRGLVAPRIFSCLDNCVTAVSHTSIEPHLRYRLEIHRDLNMWIVRSGQETWRRKHIDLELLMQLRSRVLSHRSGGAEYPIYLTDIDLAHQDVVAHLKVKFVLEAVLSNEISMNNAEIANLLRHT